VTGPLEEEKRDWKRKNVSWRPWGNSLQWGEIEKKKQRGGVQYKISPSLKTIKMGEREEREAISQVRSEKRRACAPLGGLSMPLVFPFTKNKEEERKS